jgi:hypothetical protein
MVRVSAMQALKSVLLCTQEFFEKQKAQAHVLATR